MNCYRLLYISRSLVADCHAKGAIAHILMASYRNNSRLSVSGALLFSGTHFAQILEGKKAVVDALFERIAADRLHCDLEVVAAKHCSSRMFELWTMAYCGQTRYVQGYIDRLLEERDNVDVARFEQLMRQLVDVGGIGTDDEAFQAVARAGRLAHADRFAPVPEGTVRPHSIH